MDSDIRFLIVAFDGLRPDMVNDDVAPTLAGFRRQGVNFADCRAVFPTETRVNQASLVTGCQPARHGIVANKFVDPAAGGYVNTKHFDELAAADAALPGGLLGTPSLGEVLARAGGSLAVVGCGTAGGNRILHHRADRLDALNMSLHGIDKSTTPEAATALARRIGPLPEAAIPNLAQIDWLVEAYTREVAPERDPTVTILWFSDPDSPFHFRGIESPESTTAIRHADAAFARLLDWRQASGRADDLQIVALSDHGHVRTHGPSLELERRMAAAGFSLGDHPDDGADLVLVTGTAASLYARDAQAQADVVAWLQQQDWCGPILARAVDGGGVPEGALPLADANLDHARAGDVVFVLARDADLAPGKVAGRCLHDNPEIPEGFGLHGGLSPYELATLLAFSGSRFKVGTSLDGPAGIVDVMPTVLEALGLAEWPPMDGRVLHEALAGAPVVENGSERGRRTATTGDGYTQLIAADNVAGVSYLAEGRREGMGKIDSLAV
jgi:hypothetical protein